RCDAYLRKGASHPATRRDSCKLNPGDCYFSARDTQTIPIVFSIVADPVGSGFVASLPRPGGNITGFGSVETSFASKWLELLTAIAPGVKRAAVMFNPDTA